MRALAAAEFSLSHFGAWRWGLRCLVVVVGSTVAAWLASEGSPVRSSGAAVIVAVLVMLLAWLGHFHANGAPVRLRWDGRGWSLHGAGLPGTEWQAGELSVAMDLGMWMLLRFDAADTSVRPRVAWVPAQRAGHASQWHALRCAVYSPRPDAGVDAAPDV